MRSLLFAAEAWEDFEYWLDSQPETVERIRQLVKECQRTPFSGTGKPEPLKHELSGYWSRRINGNDRMVYKVSDDCIFIATLRLHYKK
ncbi:MAG: Txe/YoeB family addiction module toxin [Victivallaceae bacterium]|nr:Txe/YoeB family addiction module toxin [Victivallaceae bacterium]